jgi:putative MATE family efflux protein
MSLPAIGMMFFNALFFLVDTIFVSWLGELATAAVSLTFPTIIVLNALIEGVAGGITALAGQSLGRGETARARRVALSGLSLGYVLSLMMLPMLFPGVSAAVFERLGAAGNPQVLEMCYAYNLWLPLMAPIITYITVANCIFRLQGDTVTPLICMGIANLVNGILDPVFIFTFGWGIGGAAAATFVGRAFALLYVHRKMSRDVNPSLSLPLLPPLRPGLLRYWRPTIAIGFPVALSFGSAAFGFGAVNRILASFGHYAVAAWMLSIRIEDFYFTIAMGVGSALTPFLAFNYGRRDFGRMKEGLKAALWIAGVLMVTAGAFLFIFPRSFFGLFRPSVRVMDLAVRSLRVSLMAFPAVILQIMLNASFVATGYSFLGTAVQLMRSVVGRIPTAYFFAWWLGEQGVWWFQPISWALGTCVALACFVYLKKKIRFDG